MSCSLTDWRLSRTDDFEGAISDYTQALRVDSLNIKAFNNRAYCFAKLERFEEAVRDYSAVIDIGASVSSQQ